MCRGRLCWAADASAAASSPSGATCTRPWHTLPRTCLLRVLLPEAHACSRQLRRLPLGSSCHDATDLASRCCGVEQRAQHTMVACTPRPPPLVLPLSAACLQSVQQTVQQRILVLRGLLAPGARQSYTKHWLAHLGLSAPHSLERRAGNCGLRTRLVLITQCSSHSRSPSALWVHARRENPGSTEARGVVRCCDQRC
jgi:hypothetical protein